MSGPHDPTTGQPHGITGGSHLAQSGSRLGGSAATTLDFGSLSTMSLVPARSMRASFFALLTLPALAIATGAGCSSTAGTDELAGGDTSGLSGYDDGGESGGDRKSVV